MFDSKDLGPVVDNVMESIQTTLHYESDGSETPSVDSLKSAIRVMVREAIEQYNISVARNVMPSIIYTHKTVGNQMLFLSFMPSTSQLKIHHISGEFFEYASTLNPFSAIGTSGGGDFSSDEDEDDVSGESPLPTNLMPGLPGGR